LTDLSGIRACCFERSQGFACPFTSLVCGGRHSSYKGGCLGSSESVVSCWRSRH